MDMRTKRRGVGTTGRGHLGSVTGYLVLGAMLRMSPAALGVEPSSQPDAVAGVEALVQRLESAWQQRDTGALHFEYSNDEFLWLRPEQSPDGTEAVAFDDKDQSLSVNTRQWHARPPITRHFTARDIAVRGDWAWLSLDWEDRQGDKLVGQAQTTTLAVRRRSTWKLVFMMPRLVRPATLVLDVQPGSLAAIAGVQAGDLIVSYGGDAVVRAETLQSLVGKHAADPPGQPPALVFRRGAEEQRREVPPGELGLRCEDRLTPEEPAAFVEAPPPHPIRELVQAELAAMQAGDVEALFAQLHPSGFLGVSADGAQLFGRSLARRVFPEQIKHFGEAIDPSTARFENVQIVARDNLALASSRLVARKREAGQTMLSEPRALGVYVRQGQKWYLAAVPPWPVELGTSRGVGQ